MENVNKSSENIDKKTNLKDIGKYNYKKIK